MTDGEWQALATVILVFITAFYAWQTRSLAGRARESAEAAEKSAHLAARSLQLQAIPILDYSVSREGYPELTNIGTGPAFSITVDINNGTVNFGPYAMLAAVDQHLITAAKQPEPASGRFSVTIQYYDVLGTPYRVRKDLLLKGESIPGIAHKPDGSADWIDLIPS